MRRMIALAVLLGALVIALPGGREPRAAGACAFAQPPTTYETTEDRRLYLAAIDLAGYDMLFTRDAFFSQPAIDVGSRANRTRSADVYFPPTIMKAISWIESVTTQAAASQPFGSIGPALVSFDCGYGIAQVTTGMTIPLGDDGQPTAEQSLVATHFAYNIGRGAAILVDKWNAAPEARPIAGVDTGSDPHLVENWYFAIWSYNGFTGPGANRSNHPLDPIYGSWPRTPYSCGPANDGFSHNRSLFPYQEIAYGCAARPPVVRGVPLWQPMTSTLPDLNNFYWRTPLDISNFVYPYSRMDMVTPQPAHTDPTVRPSLLARYAAVGVPNLALDRSIVAIDVKPGQSATTTDVVVSNAGSNIMPWRATADRPWVRLSQTSGTAFGDDLPCLPASPCERSVTLHITVDPNAASGGDAAGVHIQSLLPFGQRRDIAVFVHQLQQSAIGIPGISKN